MLFNLLSLGPCFLPVSFYWPFNFFCCFIYILTLYACLIFFFFLQACLVLTHCCINKIPSNSEGVWEKICMETCLTLKMCKTRILRDLACFEISRNCVGKYLFLMEQNFLYRHSDRLPDKVISISGKNPWFQPSFPIRGGQEPEKWRFMQVCGTWHPINQEQVSGSDLPGPRTGLGLWC